MFLVFFFFQKIGFDISCKLSPGDNLLEKSKPILETVCMKCQNLCSDKDKKKYSQLSLSRIPRDSLKHFEISVPRHIRVERVRKTIN